MPLKDTNNIQESMIEIVHFNYGLLIKDFRRDDLTLSSFHLSTKVTVLQQVVTSTFSTVEDLGMPAKYE